MKDDKKEREPPAVNWPLYGMTANKSPILPTVVGLSSSVLQPKQSTKQSFSLFLSFPIKVRKSRFKRMNRSRGESYSCSKKKIKALILSLYLISM